MVIPNYQWSDHVFKFQWFNSLLSHQGVGVPGFTLSGKEEFTFIRPCTINMEPGSTKMARDAFLNWMFILDTLILASKKVHQVNYYFYWFPSIITYKNAMKSVTFTISNLN